MAGAFASALLDELMGRNRDKHPDGQRKTHWSDPEVCKFFLCGFCPHYLFTNTRVDLGRCVKIHDEDYRASYQKSSRYEKMGYEAEFSKFLLTLISDVDKRIRRGEQRLVLNSQPIPIPTTSQMTAREKRIKQLTEQINKLVEEAESLGCEGNVDEAQKVMVLCEQLRDECTTLTGLNEAELRALEMANEPAKAMQVCATCGALLVIGDPHQRLDEHVSGKQHKGFAQIRSYLDQRRLVGTEPAILIDQQLSGDLSSVIQRDDEDGSEVSAANAVISDREEFIRLNPDLLQYGDQQQQQCAEDAESRCHQSRVLSRHRSRSGDKSHSSSRHSSSPHRCKRHRHRHRHSAHSSRHHHSSSNSRHRHHTHNHSKETGYKQPEAEDLVPNDYYC